MPGDRPTGSDGERLSELRASARGWHGVQLALLGFIGLCGVLVQDSPANPTWLEVLAGLLALAALVVACLATYLVGRAAWPLYGPRLDEGREDLVATSRRLTSGLRLTFLAVALIALSASSGWWPTSEEDAAAGGVGAVELQAGGATFCGFLQPARQGVVGLATGGRTIAIPIGSVTEIRPVDGCE